MVQDQTEAEEQIDVVAAWGPYMSDEERARIEEETWDSDAIKVWPLGPDGPVMTLREVAAWRAEHQRMAEGVSEGSLAVEKTARIQ